jgi:hypothetical protein
MSTASNASTIAAPTTAKGRADATFKRHIAAATELHQVQLRQIDVDERIAEFSAEMKRAVEMTTRERDGIVATVCKKRRAAASAEADFQPVPGQCFGGEKGQAALRPRL